MTPNTGTAAGRDAGPRPPGAAVAFGANLTNPGGYGIAGRIGIST